MSWPRRVAGAGVVLALTAFTLAPFGVMLATALHPVGAVAGAPSGGPFAWGNLEAVLGAFPFVRFFANTVVFSGAVVAGQVVTSVLAGYALARLQFAGRGRVVALLVGLLVLPGMVVIFPRFLLLRALGWVDTLGGLISTELVSAWGILLMREAFRRLPPHLDDAARLDGAGAWALFREIALPPVAPAVLTLGLFAFVDAWRAYLWPLVATRSLGLRTVEVGLASFHGFYYSQWPYQMAGALVTALPLLLVFVLAQRSFLRGIPSMGMR